MRNIFKPPYSIRQLMVAQFGAVVFMAIVAAVLMMVFWRIPSIRAETQNQQLRLADLVLKQIEGELDNAESIVTTLAPLVKNNSPEAVGTSYQAKGISGSNASLLEVLAGKGDLYEGIYLLDRSMTIKALGVAGDSRTIERQWVGNDLAGLKVLHRAISSFSITWSDHFVSPVTGRTVVGVALAAGNSIIFSEVSSARLASTALKAGEKYGLLIMVLDSKGEIIAAPDMVYSKRRYNLMRLPMVKAMTKGTPEFGRFEYQGRAYTGTAVKSDRLGWGVIVATPEDVVNDAFMAPILNATLIILFSLGTGLFFCFAISNAMGRQFDESIEYARSIMSGRYVPLKSDGSVKELEELKESLSRLSSVIGERDLQMRSIVDLAPNMAIKLFNHDARVIDWNPASEKILGFSKPEAIGKKLSELIFTEDENDGFLEILSVVEMTGEPFGPYEGTIKRKDGERRCLLSSVFLLPNTHGRSVFACMSIDVTDFKTQERSLRESEQKFNIFFNSSPAAVAVCERVGDRCIYRNVNDAWEKLMRRYRVDVINNDVVSLGVVKDAGAFAQYIDNLMDNKSKAKAELTYCRGDGSFFFGRSAAELISSGDQELIIFSIRKLGEIEEVETTL